MKIYDKIMSDVEDIIINNNINIANIFRSYTVSDIEILQNEIKELRKVIQDLVNVNVHMFQEKEKKHYITPN